MQYGEQLQDQFTYQSTLTAGRFNVTVYCCTVTALSGIMELLLSCNVMCLNATTVMLLNCGLSCIIQYTIIRV